MLTLTRTQSVVHDSLLDASDKEVYTEGDCWLLAKELSDRDVGDIVLVGESADPGDSWVHMAIKLPNGLILDAFGLWIQKEFDQEWFHFFLECPVTVSVTELDDTWESLVLDQVPYSSMSDVKRVADHLEDFIQDFC